MSTNLSDSEIKLINNELSKIGLYYNPDNKHIELVADNMEEVYKMAKRAYFEEKKEFLHKEMDEALSYLTKPVKNPLVSIEVLPVSKNTMPLFRFLSEVFSLPPIYLNFGRSLKFFLWDNRNNKPVAVANMISPTFKMKARDEYLGINDLNREDIVNRGMYLNVFNVFYPYNTIFTELLVNVLSPDVIELYRRKYEDKITLIKKRNIDPHLLFVYTISRLDPSVFKPAFFDYVGDTKGYGSFHLPSSIKSILRSASKKGYQNNFFAGSSYDLTAISSTLGEQLTEHHLPKHIYVSILASNYKEILRDPSTAPNYRYRSYTNPVLPTGFNDKKKYNDFRLIVHDILNGSYDMSEVFTSL
jgi:hypothetical protein